jgi:hypothetical protein
MDQAVQSFSARVPPRHYANTHLVPGGGWLHVGMVKSSVAMDGMALCNLNAWRYSWMPTMGRPDTLEDDRERTVKYKRPQN